MAEIPEGEPTEELSHTLVGYEEQVLAPDLEIEKRVDNHAMQARVDALESRLRDLDALFNRLAGSH